MDPTGNLCSIYIVQLSSILVMGMRYIDEPGQPQVFRRISPPRLIEYFLYSSLHFHRDGIDYCHCYRLYEPLLDHVHHCYENYIQRLCLDHCYSSLSILQFHLIRQLHHYCYYFRYRRYFDRILMPNFLHYPTFVLTTNIRPRL